MAREQRSARGPLDPRVLALSPALRTHLVVSSVLAGVVAAAVLAQAESISRLLPRLVGGDAGATTPLVAALVAVGLVRAGAAAATEMPSWLKAMKPKGAHAGISLVVIH